MDSGLRDSLDPLQRGNYILPPRNLDHALTANSPLCHVPRMSQQLMKFSRKETLRCLPSKTKRAFELIIIFLSSRIVRKRWTPVTFQYIRTPGVESTFLPDQIFSAASHQEFLRECSEMFRNVQKCSEMFRNVQKCSEMFRNVQKCSEMFRNVQKWRRILTYKNY